jgi:hypothetical protein
MIAITRAAGKPLPVEGDPDVGCTLYVQRLVQWLRSQGRISQANRFAEWDAFIESFEPERSQEIILRALTFAHEFDLSSAPTLDDFTEGVVENLSEVLPQTQWRYDETAAAHSRVQYHLGMLGAEILSRASRQRFLASKKKLVIAPACMRTRHLEILLETRCQAIGTSARELCQGCTPSCRIRQITQMGLKEGFQVYIFSDGERSAGLNSLGRDEGVAIINIDCALNIWASTWAAEDAGFPVQSLILDFASCSRYWNPIAPVDSEVVTDINIEKFARILRD